jgi:antitoxin (DNA-binding transcriptional repressor) of toxin-antitoxin stability system
MKTATVRQLRTSFPRIESWLAAGEIVSITKRRKIVAELSLPRVKTKPDFAKRFALAENYEPTPDKLLRDVLDQDRGP